MVVQAVDHGTPALSNTAHVTIIVLSSSQRPPDWIIPESDDFIKYIREVCDQSIVVINCLSVKLRTSSLFTQSLPEILKRSSVQLIGVARGGPEGPGPPQQIRKNIKASLLNLTLNMRYKMTKNIKFVITRFVFFKLKMHQNPFSAGAPPWTPLGELTMLPRPPSRLGRGIPSPHSPPRSTASASRIRRLGSQAPSTQNPGYANGSTVSPPETPSVEICIFVFIFV